MGWDIVRFVPGNRRFVRSPGGTATAMGNVGAIRPPRHEVGPMRIFRSLPAALALALLSSSFAAPPARAAETGPIKIAVITDMSGVYAALAGPGAVEATKMAVEDFGGKVLGRTVEVIRT